MKTTNNNYSKFYLLILLASTIGFSQEEKKLSEVAFYNNNATNIGTDTNPYFISNELEGEMLFISEEKNEINNPIIFYPENSVSNVLKTKHDTAKNSVGNIR